MKPDYAEETRAMETDDVRFERQREIRDVETDRYREQLWRLLIKRK